MNQIRKAALLLAIAMLAQSKSAFAVCGDGDTTSCRTPDGSTAVRICVHGKWSLCQATPSPTLGTPALHIGDANDPATVIADEAAFVNRWLALPYSEEEAQVELDFPSDQLATPPLWAYGQKIDALIDMYDLIAPLKPQEADGYLERLRRICSKILTHRDDRRLLPDGTHPVDPFRGRVMAAWGGITLDRDNRWNTDAVTSALITYGMAAFARRVSDNDAVLARNPSYRDEAVRFITASLETYQSFLPEQHLSNLDPFAYLTQPAGYAQLECTNGQRSCAGYRATAGKPLAYNEYLSMMKALAEVALAADGRLYRNSSNATPFRMKLATSMAPQLVAKSVAHFLSHDELNANASFPGLVNWYTQEPDPPAHTREETVHASFLLTSLAVLYENSARLNALLTRQGLSARVPLSAKTLGPFAATFLQGVWVYDFKNPNGPRNILKGYMDPGDKQKSSDSDNNNDVCAGWVTLARFDPWVWVRCRDATFHSPIPPGRLNVENHAALLRYRPPVADAPKPEHLLQAPPPKKLLTKPLSLSQ
jgi:hypothetical protein